jgi:hypothetical protein
MRRETDSCRKSLKGTRRETDSRRKSLKGTSRETDSYFSSLKGTNPFPDASKKPRQTGILLSKLLFENRNSIPMETYFIGYFVLIIPFEILTSFP